jgi:hypothetical protein
MAPKRRIRLPSVLTGGVLAVVAVVAVLVNACATTRTIRPAAAVVFIPVKLPAAPLGINVAPWDGLYAGNAGTTMGALLKKAGITQLRYGGGLTADYYNWQTNTDLQRCMPDSSQSLYTSGCATTDALNFAHFSKNARAIGGQSFVTVDYGAGNPALAAAWVKKAKTTAGDVVRLWEVGNENYGCFETNDELAEAPANYKNFKVGEDSTCPTTAEGTAKGMQLMANSYAVHAAKFMSAMKAVSPSAQIGVPWAFDETVPGAAVADNSEWNTVVLGADRKYIGFVDAHWYPDNFGGSTGGVNPTDQQVIRSVTEIPAEMGKIKATLAKYAPTAKVVVGETGVSYQATTVPCTPAGALFTAGDVLTWLSAGAQSVDWWSMNGYGNTGATCTKPDSAMFTSAAKPVPETPYIGYLLASALAQPGAELKPLTTSHPADVLAFQSVLANGKAVVALINTNTSAPEKVTFSSSLAGKKLQTVSYSAAAQNATNTKTVGGTSTLAAVKAGVTLPAESILLIKLA